MKTFTFDFKITFVLTADLAALTAPPLLTVLGPLSSTTAFFIGGKGLTGKFGRILSKTAITAAFDPG